VNAARLIVVAAIVGGAAAGGAEAAAAAGPPAVRELLGTLRLAPGACHHGQPSGSYLAVTFGTKAIRNSSSSCDSGAYTLLTPSGRVQTHRYATAADGVFDRQPLRLATSRSSYAAAPRLYLVGDRVEADLRSVVASYANGTWPIGAERATGRYDASTHQLSLQWFSGQSFTSASAATSIHLEGTFDGTSRSLARGTTVNLGTASFDAGSTTSVVHAAAGRSGGRPAAARHPRHRGHRHRVRLSAASGATSTGSPRTFLIAELVVVANLLAFLGLSRKRGRK
jgi:hypothetical protein